MFPHRLCRRYVFLPVLLIAVAALSSGCMWGVVTDATTGAPIVGAKVTVTDQSGQSVTTITDEQGVFSFSPTDLASLPEGPASIKAQATGYATVIQSSLFEDLFARLSRPQNFELLRGSSVYWHDKILHLSFLFPAGWTIEPPQEDPMGMALAPDDSNTSCAMMAAARIGSSSLDSLMKGMLAVEGMFGSDQQISALVDTTVRGLPAVRTTVTYKASSGSASKTNPATTEELDYLVGLDDTWAYQIGCSTSAGKYREWEPKFEAIVHSLETGK